MLYKAIKVVVYKGMEVINIKLIAGVGFLKNIKYFHWIGNTVIRYRQVSLAGR